MWKVLIADDEPKIRRGLAALVAGLPGGFEVVAEAEDGEEALEAAHRTLPDILLVDVCMPFRNGLELVQSINETLPGRIVIIVSGHDEFEYARAAMRLQAFDYLLKPIARETFAEALGKARAELERRTDAGRYSSWTRSQLERCLPILRERFLGEWVSGSLSPAEAAEGLAFMGISLPQPLTLLAARFPERPAPGADSQGRKLALVGLRAVVEDCLEGGYAFEDGTEIVLALQPGFDEGGAARLAEAIERRALAQLYQAPAVATRPVPDPATGLCEAYEELRSELADGGGCEAFVLLARNHIDKRYWEPDLSLESTAAELQVSPGYLSRLMKRETGFSFVEYLNRVRVKKAAQLMADPAAKAFEVAERVGYRSQHYFSRAFKKVTGSSPTESRRGAAS